MSWTLGSALLSFISSIASTSKSAPISFSLSCKVKKVSSSEISVSFWSITGPASNSSSTYIIDTPLLLSPCIIAALIGAAPLNLGNREECKLITPYFGISKTSLGKIFP